MPAPVPGTYNRTMFLRFGPAALAAAFLLAGAVQPSGPRAARVNAASASYAGGAEARARLLERHGEPALAWDVLCGNGPAGAEGSLAPRLLAELGRFAEADSLLARAPRSSNAPAAFVQRLQRARLNHEAGRHAAALDLLARDSAPDDALGSYRQYLLARVYLALGDAPAAAACLERLDSATTPEALRGPAAEERMNVLRALERPRDALAAAREAARLSTDAAAARVLMATQYELAWESGDAREAERAALRLLAEYRLSAEAGAVAADLVARGEGTRVSTSALLVCAEALCAGGDGPALRSALRVLDARQLDLRDAEARRMLWSEYHYQSGDYSRAIALARPTYEDPSLRRRSMLVMARSLRKMGKGGEAASTYEAFVRAYPNDSLAAEALYTAASLYRQADRALDAARVLDQLRRSYPSTFHGWAAAMRRAGEFSHDGDSNEAVAIYEQWLARSRRTDEAALFYLARERDRLQTGSGAMIMDELRALNPYSFYLAPDVAASARGVLRDSNGAMLRDGPGSMSEWLTQADAQRTIAYSRVLATASVSASPADLETDRAIERGLSFLEAGLRDWAEREFDAVRRRSGGSAEKSLILARAYEEYAMPWRSVRLYERARTNLSWKDRRSHSDDFRFLMHPLPYPAQVLNSAARNGVPPHLIYGMIREESRFEADVVSRAGAVGLMQLMPQTARRVAAQLDLATGIDGRLDEPAVNVSLGVWYAADLLKEGEGSVAWMLAAYNAGPGAAARWIDGGVAGAEAIDAVESIDYKETRGYVKRVVESANVYHALYFSGTRPGSPR